MILFSCTEMSTSYSVPDLDRIVSDIFELKKGGSACASILPEEEVIYMNAEHTFITEIQLRIGFRFQVG